MNLPLRQDGNKRTLRLVRHGKPIHRCDLSFEALGYDECLAKCRIGETKEFRIRAENVRSKEGFEMMVCVEHLAKKDEVQNTKAHEKKITAWNQREILLDIRTRQSGSSWSVRC